MNRRDRGLPGTRASRRTRAPAFLQSDDEPEEGYGAGLLDGISTRRRRRQYDERPEDDDMEGDDVSVHLVSISIVNGFNLLTSN
jgi:DNA replication licensing factor MCM2